MGKMFPMLVLLFLSLFRVTQQKRFSWPSNRFGWPNSVISILNFHELGTRLFTNFRIFWGFNWFLRVLFIYIASCGHFTPGHILYLISKTRIQSSIGFDNSIKYFYSGLPKSSSLPAKKYTKTSDFFVTLNIYCAFFLYP